MPWTRMAVAPSRSKNCKRRAQQRSPNALSLSLLLRLLTVVQSAWCLQPWQGLVEAQKNARQEREQKVEYLRQLSATEAKIERLEGIVRAAVTALKPAMDEHGRLLAFRAEPHVDAKVGERLNSVLRTPSNHKGLTERDIHGIWDMCSKADGACCI